MDSLHDCVVSGNDGGRLPLTEISPESFIDRLAICAPGEAQTIVFGRYALKPDGTKEFKVRNMLPPGGSLSGAWGAPKVDGAEFRYLTHFTYATSGASSITEYGGRSKANARRTRCFVADIDAGKAKHDKDPENTYPDGDVAEAAVRVFVERTGLTPNLVVRSGSGGLHLYFLIDEPVIVTDWIPRAETLKRFYAANDLKADRTVTADAARYLRAPGSLHDKTGAVVRAYSWRVDPYPLEEFGRLIGFDAAAASAVRSLTPGALTSDYSINDDILGAVGDDRPASLARVAEHCRVVRHMRDMHGRVPEPHWRGVLGIAKFCDADGEVLAHEWSSGYDGYDRRETQSKMDRWDTGPSTCSFLEGTTNQCAGCPSKGKITTPVQLGREPRRPVPAADDSKGTSNPVTRSECVARFNERYAIVRYGNKAVISDSRTPYSTPQGVRYGQGYLEVEAFRRLNRGLYVASDKEGGRPELAADVWLNDPQHRQYDGVVFAPGEGVSPNIKNLWQGFAVDPVAGDVAPWLTLLHALVPDVATSHFVLHWLAWKIQNPGGVPDSVLIFTGGKGTGKNSLFAPLLSIFGRHGMLADDPELIAGRFTGHLMHMAFGVLDEAVFVGDPRQADRIKSRITAKFMMYEQKGLDPVQGVNRCAYVMLTNHAHVWQATTDERRAVVIETGDKLRGDHEFWRAYHAWADGPGPEALLDYLQKLDITGFNPRDIPRTDALARQVELTALRDPAVSWWRTCLEEGYIAVRDGAGQRREALNEDQETEIDRNLLRQSWEDSAGGRVRGAGDWHVVGKRLSAWTERREAKRRTAGGAQVRRDILPPLPKLRELFTAATGVSVQ